MRLSPQSTIWYRSYLVVGSKERCAQIASELVDHVDYGSRQFARKTTPFIEAKQFGDSTPFHLFALPVRDSLPVFIIRHKLTGKTIYTTDPYVFIPQEKLELAVPEGDPDYDYFKNTVGYALDGQSEYLGLAGFAVRKQPEEAGWRKISEVVPAHRSEYKTQFDVDVWVKPDH